MFSEFPPEIFSDVLRSSFEFLDEKYVSNLAPEIQEELDRLFYERYDVRFLIVDSASGNPLTKVPLSVRSSAVTCARMMDASVGILLTER